MQKAIARAVVWFLVALTLPAALFATETGNLKVFATDAEGLPLPGVLVTGSSAVMMQPKTAMSDDRGVAHFTRLIPGVYKFEASLEGFDNAVADNIRVSVETDKSIELSLRPAIGEVLIVSAATPIIDTSTNTVADHIRLEQVEALPVGRDYVAYMQLVPGVNMVPNAQGVDTPADPAGKGGLNYRDRTGTTQIDDRSGSRDNIYYLDGLDITGLATQTALFNFNNEVILEQEIISSGVPAEYAGGKGIVANIVTKSGGRSYHGSANIYLQSKGLVQGFTTDDTRLHVPVDLKWDTAFTAGGPIWKWKDRLWFFGSAQHVSFTNDITLSESAAATPTELPYDQTRTNYFVKLTAMPSKNDQLVFSIFQGVLDVEGSKDPNVVPDRRYILDRDGDVLGLFYQRLLPAEWVMDLQYGHYGRTFIDTPVNLDAGPRNTVLFAESGVPAYEREFGGADTLRDDKNKRDFLTTRIEKFLGDHHFLGGFTFAVEQDQDSQFYNGGERLTSLDYNLTDWTLGELTQAGLYDPSEVEARLVPWLNDNWGSTSEALDTNNDGVVSNDEVYVVTFGSSND
ncbi:carboxypeptidase regulatory-like domain-containing protein, partial [Acidobacteriota bacterium]